MTNEGLRGGRVALPLLLCLTCASRPSPPTVDGGAPSEVGKALDVRSELIAKFYENDLVREVAYFRRAPDGGYGPFVIVDPSLEVVLPDGGRCQ